MMNEIPGRSQFESRLPEDAAYWRDLTTRIVDAAGPILRDRRAGVAWWRPLARWSPMIGVAAAAAAAVVTVVGPPEAKPERSVTFEQMLIAEDPVGEAVLAGGDAVISLSTMFLVQSGGRP